MFQEIPLLMLMLLSVNGRQTFNTDHMQDPIQAHQVHVKLQALTSYQARLQEMLEMVQHDLDQLRSEYHFSQKKARLRERRDAQTNFPANPFPVVEAQNAKIDSVKPTSIPNVTQPTSTTAFMTTPAPGNASTKVTSTPVIQTTTTTPVTTTTRLTTPAFTSEATFVVEATPSAFEAGTGDEYADPEPSAGDGFEPASRDINSRNFIRINDLLLNGTQTSCTQWSKHELIDELKRKGTYNPDFMAWDVNGVRRFLSKRTADSYDLRGTNVKEPMTMDKNLDAIEKMISELDLKNCDIKTPEMKTKLYNITHDLRSYYQYNFVDSDKSYRQKRSAEAEDTADLFHDANSDKFYDANSDTINGASSLEDSNEQLLNSIFANLDAESDHEFAAHDDTVPVGGSNTLDIGSQHVYECDGRGQSEDGYLRLCSACRAIRVMPNRFFPPFINEVVCDKDSACLYFYDYPHGKCKQKHLNFVVLENIGSADCQVWRKYSLNVRVCCECFVDALSFFAKYV